MSLLNRLEIPYGRNRLSVRVPGECKTVSAAALPVLPGAVEEALRHPVSSPRLSEITCPGERVAVLVSDVTRQVPTRTMLLSLLEELKGREVSIIFALGLHRGQTRREQALVLGRDVLAGWRCFEHDIEACVRLGVTGSGTPVEVFREVVEADRIVCTGGIEYHYYAGYTGGCKALLPGVSSRESIYRNHSLMYDPSCQPGNTDSLVRLDLEEAGRIAGVDFILNTISDFEGRIVGAVAGSPVEAHRKGVGILDRLHRVRVEKTDVLLVSPGGWPLDINLYQAHKALENTKHAVKNGGSIILLAECSEGLGNQVFQDWLNLPVEEVLEREFVMGGHKAAFLAKLARDYRLHLVSNLPDKTTKSLGKYFTAHKTLGSALVSALEEQGDRDAKILAVTHGSHLLLEPSP